MLKKDGFLPQVDIIDFNQQYNSQTSTTDEDDEERKRSKFLFTNAILKTRDIYLYDTIEDKYLTAEKHLKDAKLEPTNNLETIKALEEQYKYWKLKLDFVKCFIVRIKDAIYNKMYNELLFKPSQKDYDKFNPSNINKSDDLIIFFEDLINNSIYKMQERGINYEEQIKEMELKDKKANSYLKISNVFTVLMFLFVVAAIILGSVFFSNQNNANTLSYLCLAFASTALVCGVGGYMYFCKNEDCKKDVTTLNNNFQKQIIETLPLGNNIKKTAEQIIDSVDQNQQNNNDLVAERSDLNRSTEKPIDAIQRINNKTITSIHDCFTDRNKIERIEVKDAFVKIKTYQDNSTFAQDLLTNRVLANQQHI